MVYRRIPVEVFIIITSMCASMQCSAFLHKLYGEIIKVCMSISSIYTPPAEYIVNGILGTQQVNVYIDTSNCVCEGYSGM